MLHVNISLISKKEESENKFYLERVQILSEKLGPFNYNKIIINRWEWTKISGSRPQTKIVANSILMQLALISFLKFIYLFTLFYGTSKDNMTVQLEVLKKSHKIN